MQPGRALLGLSFGALVACGLSVVGTSAPETERDDAGSGVGTTSSAPSGQDGGGAVQRPTPVSEAEAGSVPIVDAGDTPAVDASSDALPPEYTLTTTNGSYTINDGGALCSRDGPRAWLTFRNDGASSYRKWWIDGACYRENYGTLSPGGSETYATYSGHRWRLHRTSDDRLIVDFTIERAGDYVMTVH